ncbi:MAG: hypothetical protein M1423_10330 [Acidobacteria bacterium]|nr:hypothetical protein [Acidobacteriota bacterium]
MAGYNLAGHGPISLILEPQPLMGVQQPDAADSTVRDDIRVGFVAWVERPGVRRRFVQARVSAVVKGRIASEFHWGLLLLSILAQPQPQ